MKNMIGLYFKQSKRKILLNIILAFLIFMAVFISYKLGKTYLFKVTAVVKALPGSACSLLGITYSTETGNILFFLLFAEMFMQVWLIWKACVGMAHMMQEDEINGRIYNICNQLYGRKQIASCYYIWNILYTVGIYVIWNMILLLFATVGGFNREQRIIGFFTLVRISLKGAIVLSLMISVCFLFCTLRRKRTDGRTIANILVFGSLGLGNGYKLLDLTALAVDYIGKDAAGIEAASAVLRNLYYVSPISWMNPFTQAGWGQTVFQVMLSIAFGGLAYCMGCHFYCKKNLMR